MRGTLAIVLAAAVTVGLIPTYAGNTFARTADSHGRWAHPHVCGEHCEYRQLSLVPPGSSPRMRGTLSGSVSIRFTSGLIPTYAGNTQSHYGFASTPGAHPHVCGEHTPRLATHPPLRGSSPRMRGTPTLKSIVGEENGLIPTYAGNTTSRSS